MSSNCSVDLSEILVKVDCTKVIIFGFVLLNTMTRRTLETMVSDNCVHPVRILDRASGC